MGKCLADMPNSTLAVLLGSNLVFYQAFVNASLLGHLAQVVGDVPSVEFVTGVVSEGYV
jgi:hypothetical protein